MAYAVVSDYVGASKTTISINGIDYDVYEFAATEGGSISFSEAGDVEYLIVGGGGAGGFANYGAAGGGAGGDVLQGRTSVTSDSFSITIGHGGTGSLTPPAAGGNSAVFGMTAYGGGCGASSVGTYFAPTDGGGGLGRAAAESILGSTHPSGFAGGDGYNTAQTDRAGGGGRGAGGNGENASRGVGGTGGSGSVSTITGARVEYGRGGDGYHSSMFVGQSGFIPAAPSATLVGSGGSGGTTNQGMGSKSNGGNGGSGIVIIRVASPIDTTPEIPLPNSPYKLDLFNAVEIKTAQGSWAEAKGFNWHWKSDPLPMLYSSGEIAYHYDMSKRLEYPSVGVQRIPNMGRTGETHDAVITGDTSLVMEGAYLRIRADGSYPAFVNPIDLLNMHVMVVINAEGIQPTTITTAHFFSYSGLDYFNNIRKTANGQNTAYRIQVQSTQNGSPQIQNTGLHQLPLTGFALYELTIRNGYLGIFINGVRVGTSNHNNGWASFLIDKMARQNNLAPAGSFDGLWGDVMVLDSLVPNFAQNQLICQRYLNEKYSLGLGL